MPGDNPDVVAGHTGRDGRLPPREGRPSETTQPGDGDAGGAVERSSPGGGATVDEMSEWSFPASDPPATWTWDP